MSEPDEAEMRAVYVYRDLMASTEEILTMPPDWLDLDTLLTAQDRIALAIQRKRKAA